MDLIIDMPQRNTTSNLTFLDNPGYRSGRYYLTTNLITTTSSGSSSLAVNTLSYFPFYIDTSITIDRIAFLVATGGSTGSVVRFGLYTNKDALPNTLIVDGGEVDTTTTGAKELVVSTTLSPGWYWLAGNTNIVPILTISSTALSLSRAIGTSTVTTTTRSGLRQSSVTYGALPSTAPVSSLTEIAVGIPITWYRIV